MTIIVKNIEIEVDDQVKFDRQADFDIIADNYDDFRAQLENLVRGIASSHNIALKRIKVKHAPFTEKNQIFA